MTLFSIPFIVGALVGLGIFLRMTSLSQVLVLIAVIVINGTFYHLLKAPTMAGRRIMDKIEGFKMYLTVAEADTFKTLTPSEETFSLFERLFPYAVALDAEEAWSARFTNALEQAERQGHPYHPHWYHGQHGYGAVSLLGSGLTNSVSSASVAPGSHSGGGGGGSSGGGGGGGGGGGW
jgi:uncharacterized membrane protein